MKASFFPLGITKHPGVFTLHSPKEDGIAQVAEARSHRECKQKQQKNTDPMNTYTHTYYINVYFSFLYFSSGFVKLDEGIKLGSAFRLANAHHMNWGHLEILHLFSIRNRRLL